MDKWVELYMRDPIERLIVGSFIEIFYPTTSEIDYLLASIIFLLSHPTYLNFAEDF